MKTFNITAQIYNGHDITRQTILMNEVVKSANAKSAEDYFKLSLIENNDILLQILSIEEIAQVAS